MSALTLQRSPASGRFILLALGVSLGVHLALYGALRPQPTPPQAAVVQVQWVEAAAQARPVVQEKPAPLPPAVALPRVKRVVHKGPVQHASAPAAPPAPTAAEPPRAPPPPPVGLDFASTVAASSFVVPLGTTLQGAPPRLAAEARPASAPAHAGRGGRYVPFDQVSEPPVLLDEVRAAYPDAARTAGITGEVVLLLTIDAEGRVAEAHKLSGPGHGLDEAALAAIWRFRFRPAQSDGQPVATVIRYIYSFDIG